MARRWLFAGATIVAIGVALVGTVGGVTGGWVVLGGWVVTVWGLHVFGRSGSSEPPAPSGEG